MSENLSHFAQDTNSPKMIQRQRSHRKLLSGLKLLPDSCRKRRVEVSEDERTQASEHQLELPHDLITYEILTRLPIKSLLQFKSVSKEWYSTISSHEFAKAKFNTCLSSYDTSSPVDCLLIQAENNHYLLFYEEEDAFLDYYLVKLEIDFDEQHKNEIQLVGSCNGLVCLAYSSPVESYFYIWNPITHNSCKFSDPYSPPSNYRTSWGFAYVSSEDDYKVVRLIQDFNTLELIVHVFSLQTQKWKLVHEHGLNHSVSLSKSTPGVLVNEKLFWLVDSRGPAMNPLVMGFSLELEKFEKVHDLEPKSITPWNQSLCVMGGCLSMYGLNMQEEVYVSILKRPGVVESICLSPELGPRFCSGLMGYTRAGRFFVVSKSWQLALIDPNVLPTQNTPLINFKNDRRPSVVRYVPSLISPSSVLEVKKS